MWVGEAELSTKDRGESVGKRGFREPHDAIEPIAVGKGESS